MTRSNAARLLLYSSPAGHVQVQVLYQGKSFWMPQREATVSILETVCQEGARQVTRVLEHYNLDAVIAVGDRVDGYQATQLRGGATRTLDREVQRLQGPAQNAEKE